MSRGRGFSGGSETQVVSHIGEGHTDRSQGGGWLEKQSCPSACACLVVPFEIRVEDWFEKQRGS